MACACRAMSQDSSKKNDEAVTVKERGLEPYQRLNCTVKGSLVEMPTRTSAGRGIKYGARDNLPLTEATVIGAT